MAHHDLKTDPEVFKESWEMRKLFELRFNDRNFKEGDTVNLLETVYSGAEMKAGQPLVYTGRLIEADIRYILDGGYGLREGWVIFSIIHATRRMKANV